MEDKQIVEMFFQRDEKAINETINKYQKYCFSIAKNILVNKEDILEVLNDAYLSVWNAIPPKRPNNLSTFIGKITRNLAISKYRFLKAKKRSGYVEELSFDELAECIPDKSIGKDVQLAQLTDAINKFLSKLNEKDCSIFVCRYWYGDDINKIALRQKCSVSNVKMTLKRSRDKLKEYLIREGYVNE